MKGFGKESCSKLKHFPVTLIASITRWQQTCFTALSNCIFRTLLSELRELVFCGNSKQYLCKRKTNRAYCLNFKMKQCSDLKTKQKKSTTHRISEFKVNIPLPYFFFSSQVTRLFQLKNLKQKNPSQNSKTTTTFIPFPRRGKTGREKKGS